MSILSKLSGYISKKEKVAKILSYMASTDIYKEYGAMCIAIAYDNFLLDEEKDLALEAIDEYLKESGSFLSTALRLNNLPSDFEDRREIYLNWNNRPKLTVKTKLIG